jgi:integrase
MMPTAGAPDLGGTTHAWLREPANSRQPRSRLSSSRPLRQWRQTSPQVYASRADAKRDLWAMARDGRADCDHDRRYRALVPLATFASLRWGEASALRRCDVDLTARTVQVRYAFAERSTGELLLGPPKSRASRRVVGIPDVIIPMLREHLLLYVPAEPVALFFPGVKGGPLRRGNFNKMSGWPEVVRGLGWRAGARWLIARKIETVLNDQGPGSELMS